MKRSFTTVLFAAVGSAAMAQTPPASTPQPLYLPGRQLSIQCEHDHPNGDLGSTKLYEIKTVKTTDLPKVIRVGRLTAINVHFVGVNTLCYSYDAGVTKETAFYGAATPGPLKNFVTGSLATSVLLAGKAGTKFDAAQTKFVNDVGSYLSLGALSDQIRGVFQSDVLPQYQNKQIRDSVQKDLRGALGYTDRDVTPQDLQLRQEELKTGTELLAKDLADLRAQMSGADSQQVRAEEEETLKQDEKVTGVLDGQLENYATALTNLDAVQHAPDFVDKIVLLDPKYDDYTVTVAISLLSRKPAGSDVAIPSTQQTSSFIVQIVGGYVLDFSTGVVATSPVSRDYYVLSTGTSKTVMNGGERNPAFVPAAFLHYYNRPAPGQFSIGPTFGVDVSSGQNYFFGASLVRGGAERIMLVGGLAINKLTVLNGDKVGSPPANGATIQTKVRYGVGWFVGLTFNFGGI